MVDREFKPLSGQTIDHETDSCCISAKPASLRIKEQILIVSESGWCVRVERLVYPWIVVWSALFDRTNIMHMTPSMSRRLNILCIIFKIMAFFVVVLFAQLYVRVGILFIYGNHLHDRIISLRGEVWASVWAHETTYVA